MSTGTTFSMPLTPTAVPALRTIARGAAPQLRNGGALESVVGAPAASLRAHLRRGGQQTGVVAVGEQCLGCAELHGQLQPRGINVDRDDAACPTVAHAEHGAEAHAAAAEDHHCTARGDLKGNRVRQRQHGGLRNQGMRRTVPDSSFQRASAWFHCSWSRALAR